MHIMYNIQCLLLDFVDASNWCTDKHELVKSAKCEKCSTTDYRFITYRFIDFYVIMRSVKIFLVHFNIVVGRQCYVSMLLVPCSSGPTVVMSAPRHRPRH